MHLLVTGGAGFIGSAVVRQAIAQGHRVTNLDALTYAGRLENLTQFDDDPNYSFVHGDVCNANLVREVFASSKPDAVMHLAAESHVDRSIEGPAQFIQTNVVGTGILLEAAHEHWIARGRPAHFRFLHISTDEVYGSLTRSDPPFTETTAYAPNSPYSASKAGSDHLVRAWGETYGLPVLISNCSNNYGPYQFPEKLIPVTIIAALKGKPIPVYGTGENVRDWLYVDDHADALLQLVTRAQAGRTYNIGGNAECRNVDLVEMLCTILDELRPAAHPHFELVEFVTDRAGHDFRYAIDASRIRQEIGWEPLITLEDGLRRTVGWYLDHKNWWQPILDKR